MALEPMLDSGLVLFVGLMVLIVWRTYSQTCLKEWLVYANTCSLLYVLLFILLVYALVMFAEAGIVEHMYDERISQKLGFKVPWLMPFAAFTPIAAVLTFISCVWQSFQHLGKIREGDALSQRERVVMIIALPAVYSVMTFTALVGLCRVVDNGNSREDLQKAKELSETAFRVGDLYEAWVLYQFGKLTLELIKASLLRLEASEHGESKGTAKGLLVAHEAVERLMWLGTWMFVVVCVLQSGWQCWTQAVAHRAVDKDGNPVQDHTGVAFNAAGVVASFAAIYNVHIVESTYQSYVQGYSPFLKFVSVKLLVSFAFFQRSVFISVQTIQQTLPGFLGRVLPKLPILRELIYFTPEEFEIFYAALIMYEIYLVAALHGWAWRTTEEWYDTYNQEAKDYQASSSNTEEQIRLAKKGQGYGTVDSLNANEISA